MKINNETITLSLKGTERTYKVQQMPKDFFDWQIENRLKSLKIFLGLEKGMPNFSPHSVVMSTISEDEEFPINSCIKGLGLVPKDEYLNNLAEEALKLIDLAKEKGAKETMKERIEFLLNLYSKPEIFNKNVLSSIEIYYKKTYANVLKNPTANLLFYDNTTGYSIMFNSVVELVPRNTPYHKYVTAVHDLFHVPKDPKIKPDRFEYAYRFWLVEAYDKTPGPQASQKIF